MINIDEKLKVVKHETAFPISYSKVRTLYECPAKFYKQYLIFDKDRGVVNNQHEFDMGNIIHKVLERTIMYGPARSWDYTLVDFNAIWNTVKNSGRYACAETHKDQVTELYVPTKEAFQTIYGFIKKNGYTPKEEYNVVVTRDGRFTNYGRLPWSQQFFRGYIDLFLQNKNKAIIIDYKKDGYDRHQNINNFQLTLYAYIIFNFFPEIEKINTIDYYIKDRKMVGREEGPFIKHQDFKMLEEYIDEEVDKFVERVNSIDNRVKCTKDSERCNWCPFFNSTGE